MMVIMHNLSKILLIFVFISCSAQKKVTKEITIDKVMNFYIDYSSSIDKDFNQKNKYLVLGISDAQDKLSNKKIYIMNFCFNCPSPITQTNNSVAVQYNGYKMIIVFDNIVNKKYILSYLKNIKKTESFNTVPIPDNVMYNYKSWTIEYDKKNDFVFFCAGKDTRKIKQELKINEDVEDCILD